MHAIVVTHGLVLGKRAVGESNTMIALLTPERGLVRATARSARKEVSKLRYGLEVFSGARFSLLRGRNEWKIVGVEEVSALSLPTTHTRACAGKIAKLLLRLVHGEEPAPELFALVREGFDAIAQHQAPHTLDALEWVFVLRLLAQLGYLPETPELSFLLEWEPDKVFLSEEEARRAQEMKRLLIKTINESLAATGL
jgi:DNA repair protein RecO (recombination protein O)